jgi:hypothetical protein
MMRKFTYAVLLTGGFMVALGGCAAYGGKHDFKIGFQTTQAKISVIDEGLKVTLIPERQCRNSKAQNCIQVPKDDVAKIDFELHESADWYFTKFTMYPVATSTEKDICNEERIEGAPACYLSLWQRVEFGAIKRDDPNSQVLVPGPDGIIDLTNFDKNGVQAFSILNQNLLRQEYFYTVDVCMEGLTNCKPLDPPLKNDGKGDGADSL